MGNHKIIIFIILFISFIFSLGRNNIVEHNKPTSLQEKISRCKNKRKKLKKDIKRLEKDIEELENNNNALELIEIETGTKYNIFFGMGLLSWDGHGNTIDVNWYPYGSGNDPGYINKTQLKEFYWSFEEADDYYYYITTKINNQKSYLVRDNDDELKVSFNGGYIGGSGDTRIKFDIIPMGYKQYYIKTEDDEYLHPSCERSVTLRDNKILWYINKLESVQHSDYCLDMWDPEIKIS